MPELGQCREELPMKKDRWLDRCYRKIVIKAGFPGGRAEFNGKGFVTKPFFLLEKKILVFYLIVLI